jgi:ribosome-associated protein
MHEEDDIFDGPSKSAMKRQMTALQDLGEALVALTPKEMARIPIADDTLLAAIDLARTIHSNSGLRRQMQYIGKLMRGIDAQPIAKALSDLHQQHQQDISVFQELEELRDHLTSTGPAGIETVMQRFPGADRQRLRQLVLQHQKEQRSNKPPAAARKLFKYLREICEAH